MPSLSDRLKSLGVNVGAQNIPPPQPANLFTIDRVLDGHPSTTPQGETYIVEARYSIDYAQGTAPLWVDQPLDAIAAWANDERIRSLDQQAFAFLDTETTGLSGGTGTYAFLIGVGRFEGTEFHLIQVFMRDPLEEPAQLAALEEFLAPCSALVTFNGKSFDVPLLTTRYRTHGWRPPLADQIHIDLLHLARRLWRDRLPSRTLPNLEYQILGALRTQDDVPGWMIPQMYFDYLRSGDARPLKSVFYHNAMDVLSLAALLSHTASLLADPLSDRIEHSEDILAMARLFEEQGQIEMAIQLYLRGMQADLPDEVMLIAMQRLALIHKRQDNLSAAVTLWEEAARRQHLHAHIELAKYYEHRTQDYNEAIYWAETALSIIDQPGFPAYEKNLWQAELEHRLARLHRKLNG
jgi:hypothetical protein